MFAAGTPLMAAALATTPVVRNIAKKRFIMSSGKDAGRQAQRRRRNRRAHTTRARDGGA
jgi:hypothetical protein